MFDSFFYTIHELLHYTHLFLKKCHQFAQLLLPLLFHGVHFEHLSNQSDRLRKIVRLFLNSKDEENNYLNIVIYVM